LDGFKGLPGFAGVPGFDGCDPLPPGAPPPGVPPCGVTEALLAVAASAVGTPARTSAAASPAPGSRHDGRHPPGGAPASGLGGVLVQRPAHNGRRDGEHRCDLAGPKPAPLAQDQRILTQRVEAHELGTHRRHPPPADRREVTDRAAAAVVRQDRSPLAHPPEQPDPRAAQRSAGGAQVVGVDECRGAQTLRLAAVSGEVEGVREHRFAMPRIGTAEPCGCSS
jgi:hypothetical protein